jgi:predicted metal-dependent peptidase
MVASKLTAARTRLILDKPFLGALVLRLPLVAAGAWCGTTATDAKSLYYNPRWIDRLSTSELQFALAHEALHCALGHFARRGHRVQRLWDLACDLAINPLLVAEGLKPPPEALVLDLYAGMAAEEIYPCLEDTLDDGTLDDHSWDGDEGGQGESGSKQSKGGGGSRREMDEKEGGSTPVPTGGADGADGEGPPMPLTGLEKEKLKQQWQRNMAAAAQRAREAGKLSGGLSRLVEVALAPVVSWRALLGRHLSQVARTDYTYTRPSRREGDIIRPGLRSPSGELAVALDVSGSVSDADMAEFLGEINALKGAMPVAVTLFACDVALAPECPWRFEAWEDLTLPKSFAGGGGTAFSPVFDWLEQAGKVPDALIYFTDAEGKFPATEPDYPVLWLVKGKSPVPWGRRIQLN